MENEIPYDIIYNIYLLSTDYKTALSFYVLNKEFYTLYLKNRKKPKEKLVTLRFQEMFQLIEHIPEMSDLSFRILSSYNSQYLREIRYTYLLYYNIISNELIKNWDSNKCIPLLTHAIIINGFHHLNNSIKITIKENNKVELKIINLKQLLTYKMKYSFFWIKQQMVYFDIFII